MRDDRSRTTTLEYRDGWERVFGKNGIVKRCELMTGGDRCTCAELHEELKREESPEAKP